MGAALAGGTVWSVNVLLWGMVGVLYHLAGYGHNSITDWVNGFDKDDPHKQHHPLNTGTITEGKAKLFIRILLVLTAVLTIGLAYPDPAAMGAVGVAMICGFAYNYIGKLTELKFVFISIAHSMLFVIPFFALGGEGGSKALELGLIYMFLWIVFQISVSGEIKDIKQDESNFLRNLGVNFKEMPHIADKTWMEFSGYAKKYAYSLKTLTIITSILIAVSLNSDAYIYMMITILSVVMISGTVNLMSNGKWDRNSKVSQMSLIEMYTTYMFIVSFIGIIGVIAAGFIIGLSTLWVIGGNRLLWGTFVAPDV